MAKEKLYICIDLKSFYASVECIERGLDPMTARLIVADPERGDRTISLAATPAMKALGIKGRCRVYEIPKWIDYIMAPPRMALYIEYSTRIYAIYMRYVAKEDIHVYSIDEVFIDATDYIATRQIAPEDFARLIMKDILESTGITATCGIGSNLYIAKIALDIISKHAEDFIGRLDEESYRRQLWQHQPLTDFWRIGRGTAERLNRLGISTMYDIAHTEERILYKSFGVDAELLIDHAWGRETATIADIKAYVPRTSSISSGQVLPRGYDYEHGRIIIREMAEALALELYAKGLVTASLTLYLMYRRSSDSPPSRGSASLDAPTCSVRKLTDTAVGIYERIMNRDDEIVHVGISYNKISPEEGQQYDIFSDPEEQEKERRLQDTVLSIRQKYGKNGIVKCMNLLEGATMIERNSHIGGHRA